MANLDQSVKEQSEKVVATALFGSEMSRQLRGPEGRMAASLRRKNEAANPTSIIDSLAVPAYPSVELKGTIDRVMSAKEDPVTHERSRPAASDFETNFNEAMKRANFVQDFLKKGYTRLTPREQIPYQVKARDALLKVWPGAVEGMANLKPNQMAERMDRMLRDPKFAAAMREALGDVIEGAKGRAEVPPEVADKVKAAKHEMEEKEAEKKWADDDHQRVFDEYDREFVSGGAGSRGAELASLDPLALLESNKSAADATVNEKVNELVALRQEKADARSIKDAGIQASEMTRIAGEIARVTGEQNTAKVAASKAAELLEKRKALEAEKRKLEEEERRLARELSKKEMAARRASDTYYLAKAEEEGAGMDVRNFEASFMSKLDGVMEAATKKYLEGEVTSFERVRDEILSEIGDEALVEGINNRWVKNVESGEFNEKRISDDYRQLLSKGPDELVIRVLTEGGKMSVANARARMENDKEFADRARNEVAQRLLTKRVETGTITDTEARRIVDSEWGGDEIIANAFMERAKYDGVLQLLESEQGTTKRSLMEKLKAMPGGKLAKFLIALLLFGTLFAIDMIGGFGIASLGGKLISGAATSAGNLVSGIPKVDGVISGVQDKGGEVIGAIRDKVSAEVPVVRDVVLPIATDQAGDVVSGVGTGGISGSSFDGVVDPLKTQYQMHPLTTIGVGAGAAALTVNKLRSKGKSGHGS